MNRGGRRSWRLPCSYLLVHPDDGCATMRRQRLFTMSSRSTFEAAWERVRYSTLWRIIMKRAVCIVLVNFGAHKSLELFVRHFDRLCSSNASQGCPDWMKSFRVWYHSYVRDNPIEQSICSTVCILNLSPKIGFRFESIVVIKMSRWVLTLCIDFIEKINSTWSVLELRCRNRSLQSFEFLELCRDASVWMRARVVGNLKLHISGLKFKIHSVCERRGAFKVDRV